MGSLFDGQGLAPHGFCLLWNPALIWLHASSDLAIGLAYYSIPVALAYMVWKRTDIAFGWVFWMFAAFILACGTTHLFSIWTLWHADYGAEGLAKFVTAVISVATAAVLWPLVPRVMALPSPAQLRHANDALSDQVREHVASLETLRQTQHALRESEQRFRLVVEAAPSAMVLVDPAGTIVLVNTQVERDFGYSRDELLGQPIEVLVPQRFRGRHPGLRESFFNAPRRRPMGAGGELHGCKKDGSEFPVEIGLNPIDTDEGTMVLAAIVDITERVAADLALRESERRYSIMVDGVIDYAVYMLDPNGIVTNWNRGAERIKGYRAEEVVGRHFACFYTDEERAAHAPQHALEVAVRDGRYEEEALRVRKDGSRFWASAVLDALRDDEGRLIGFAKITRDITERVEAERALRESERRYRERAELLLHESERRYQQIFNTVGVAIWEEDLAELKAAIEELRAQGVEDFGQYLAAHPDLVRQLLSQAKIVDANQRALGLFGAASKDEFLGPVDRLFLPEDRDALIGALVAFSDGRSSFETELSLAALDGSKLDAICAITLLPGSGASSRALVSITDITELRRAQESLQQAQDDLARLNRVMLLGEMTASIAHEVRQPITGTVINASTGLRWLAMQPPDVEEARKALERILSDGNRAGEVINRIRALIKQVPQHRDPLNVNEAILEVIAMTQAELQRNRVALQTRLSGELPLVLADRVQLQQVILNLIVNAIEAMSTMADRPRELVVGTGRTESNEVFVEVRDSGAGLDPANFDRLFQSFYTTKPDGMGMGLAISRSIVEDHGGRLWATANTPHGAVFRFTLSVAPVAAEEPPADRVELPA